MARLRFEARARGRRAHPRTCFTNNNRHVAVTWVLACGVGRELVGRSELSLKRAQLRWLHYSSVCAIHLAAYQPHSVTPVTMWERTHLRLSVSVVALRYVLPSPTRDRVSPKTRSDFRPRLPTQQQPAPPHCWQASKRVALAAQFDRPNFFKTRSFD